jgi:hypothetical protein
MRAFLHWRIFLAPQTKAIGLVLFRGFFITFPLRNHMYIPKIFEVTDNDEIFKFIEANAFGQLISFVAGQHFATHMPFLLSPDKTHIVGHIDQT